MEKGRHIAEFKGSEKSKPLARIGVDRELFQEFLRIFRVEKVSSNGKAEVFATDRDIAFELAIIYAYLLRALKKEKRAKLCGKITESLLRLHMHELTFWNHHFSRAKNRYEQDRVARAFLTLYNLR